MLMLQIPLLVTIPFSNSELRYQIVIHSFQKLYHIMEQSDCASSLYHERISQKVSLLATAEIINLKDPLIKDFIKPLIDLLKKWQKDHAVCNACRVQIEAQYAFALILDRLHGIIRQTNQGRVIPKTLIDLMIDEISTTIDNVKERAFCINFQTFAIKDE